ncbi:MAG: hypothetical protein ACI9LV_000660 [Candidatus Nanohaloarchaea archaeon]
MNTKLLVPLIAAVIVSGGLGYMGGQMEKQSEIDRKDNMIDSQEERISSLESQVSELEQERNQAQINSMTPADDLRVGLNSDLKEHVDLGLIALRNAYDGDADTQASVAQLDQNSQDLAAKVGSVYGDEAEQQFLGLWRDHIGYFVDYTEGLKADNQTKMDRADQNLEGYAESAGTFFNDANPNIPRDGVVTLAEEHKTLVIESMEAYDEGNYEMAYQKQREANKQVSKIADALTAGIVEQNPETFQPEN